MAGCYASSESLTEEDKKTVERLFTSCGYISEVPENMMDAVCGLSGSGPAYVYMFIDSLTGTYNLSAYIQSRLHSFRRGGGGVRDFCYWLQGH